MKEKYITNSWKILLKKKDASYSLAGWVCMCVCACTLIIHNFLEYIETKYRVYVGGGKRGKGSEKYKVWEENKQSLKSMGNLLPLSSQRNEMSMGR